MLHQRPSTNERWTLVGKYLWLFMSSGSILSHTHVEWSQFLSDNVLIKNNSLAFLVSLSYFKKIEERKKENRINQVGIERYFGGRYFICDNHIQGEKNGKSIFKTLCTILQIKNHFAIFNRDISKICLPNQLLGLTHFLSGAYGPCPSFSKLGLLLAADKGGIIKGDYS